MHGNIRHFYNVVELIGTPLSLADWLFIGASPLESPYAGLSLFFSDLIRSAMSIRRFNY